MSETVAWTTRMRHSLESTLVKAASRVIQMQPMVRVRAWGEALGRGAHLFARSRRRVALDNLARAFPEMPLVERERIVRRMYEHFGRMLLELIRFRTLTRDEMLALTEIEGEDS